MRNGEFYRLQLELAIRNFDNRSRIVISANKEMLPLDVRHARVVYVHVLDMIIKICLDKSVVWEPQVHCFIFWRPVVVDHKDELLCRSADWMRTIFTSFGAARWAWAAFKTSKPATVALTYTRVVPSTRIVAFVSSFRTFCTANLVFIQISKKILFVYCRFFKRAPTGKEVAGSQVPQNSMQR